MTQVKNSTGLHMDIVSSFSVNNRTTQGTCATASVNAAPQPPDPHQVYEIKILFVESKVRIILSKSNRSSVGTYKPRVKTAGICPPIIPPWAKRMSGVWSIWEIRRLAEAVVIYCNINVIYLNADQQPFKTSADKMHPEILLRPSILTTMVKQLHFATTPMQNENLSNCIGNLQPQFS